MKQPPVYILNHVTQRGVVRSYVETLEETEAFTDSIAKKVLEGSGLTPGEVDIYNPYDGYTLFTQYYLEGMGWHGVKRGEAHDFYASDIRVEGNRTPSAPAAATPATGAPAGGSTPTQSSSCGARQASDRSP